MAQIKGTGIVGVVKALRARREEALKVLKPELAHYLDERAFVTAWYPEEHYLELLKAYVRVWPGRSWEDIGVHGARETLEGIYRNVIVPGDLPATASKMRVNWRNYHDSGELTAQVCEGFVRVQVEGYTVVSADLCRLNTGYFRELLSRGGAAIQTTHKVECTARGDARCIWEFTLART